MDKLDNRQAIREYDIKKELVDKSSTRMKAIDQKIDYYKYKIEENFNPAAYRIFLEKTFSLKHKN